jgi:hypothetical protein
MAFGELVTVMLGERLPADKETCRKVAESVPIISLTPIGQEAHSPMEEDRK